MDRDEDTAARMERVAEIEAKLDPDLRRRGRFIADLVTFVVVAPVAIALDFHVTRPLLLLGLMGAALALNHLIPRVTERRLRQERNRLLGGTEAVSSDSSGGPGP